LGSVLRGLSPVKTIIDIADHIFNINHASKEKKNKLKASWLMGRRCHKDPQGETGRMSG